MLGANNFSAAILEQLNFVALCVLTGLSTFAWATLLRRRHSLQSAVQSPAATDVPWGLLDVWVIVLTWFFCFSLAALLADPKSSDRAFLNWIHGGAMLASTALGMAWLILRYGPTAANWILPRNWGRETGLGLIAFLAVVPPIFWLMTVLVQFLPYHHETLDQIKASPTAGVIVSSFFSAALAAAIGEEFFFRCVLLGWLQRVRSSSSLEYRRRAMYGDPRGAIPMGEAPVDSALGTETQPSVARSHVMLAIVGSSLIFAALHWGQGPAPIALFLLGLALGYLYWASRSLLACIVLHAAMNAYSLTWETLAALQNASMGAGG